MKIAYVVPGIMEEKEMDRRENLLNKWAFEGVRVKVIGITEGPASIESMYEEYLSIPATAEKMYQLEKKGYDAAILGCAGDPGLDGMREITREMLVVGPGQSSMQVAVMLGNSFSVLTVTDSTVASSYELAFKAGVKESVASVRPLNIPVLELAEDKEKSIEKIVSVGREAVLEDGADVLVLGCMSMGFLDVADDIQNILKVPVVNPAKTGLKTAEALLSSNLMHSKKAFMTPPKIAEGKVESLDELYIKKVPNY
ncbi:MAG TPA: aspartate/glutamate racemase family protein [Halanaerobiales bacterium]|nr:aspartate/glutamate racemase family protein [Halanaerobiales bacterium]